MNTGLLGEIFRSVHTIKGTTDFWASIAWRAGACGRTPAGSLRDGRLAVTSELISGLLHLLDGLRAILVLIEETGGEGTRSSDEDGELIAELALLNGAMPPAVIEPALLHAVVDTGAVAESKAPDTAPAQASANANSERNGGGTDKTLRIDVDVIESHDESGGELVLTRNQMLQSDAAAANFPELARRLDSVTADLRETVMQARMQPVGNLFGKFPEWCAISREPAAASAGRIYRAGDGAGQESARGDQDPLTHAVRNAVDMGLKRLRIACWRVSPLKAACG